LGPALAMLKELGLELRKESEMVLEMVLRSAELLETRLDFDLDLVWVVYLELLWVILLALMNNCTQP